MSFNTNIYIQNNIIIFDRKKAYGSYFHRCYNFNHYRDRQLHFYSQFTTIGYTEKTNSDNLAGNEYQLLSEFTSGTPVGNKGPIQVNLPGKTTHLCIVEAGITEVNCMEKTKEGDYVPCDLLSIAGSKGAELKGVIEQGTDKGFFLLPLGSSDIGGKRTFDLKLEQGNPLCFGDGTEIFFESQQGYALVK